MRAQSQLSSAPCLNFLSSINLLLHLAEAKMTPFVKPWRLPASARHGASTAFG